MNRYDWDWNRSFNSARNWPSVGREPGFTGGWGRGPDRGYDRWVSGRGWSGPWYDPDPRGRAHPRVGWGGPPDYHYEHPGYDRRPRYGWRWTSGGYDSVPFWSAGGPRRAGFAPDASMPGFDRDPSPGYDQDFEEPDNFEDPGVLDDFEEGWDDGSDDQTLYGRVWRSLYNDGFINAEAIEIDIHDGVVTLRGEVADYMEARYAWDDAWEAQGVRGVISKLTIREGYREEAPPDATKKSTDRAGFETGPRGSKKS